MSIEPEQAQSPVPPGAPVAGPGGRGGSPPGEIQSPGTILQTATAAESAVVIQVGGDLYLSDAGLGDLWAPRQPTTPGECPYPGLDAFGPSQAKWFYGREDITGDLLRYLDQMSRGGPGGPLLVVAPSGTGKSSLLGAGLLTALAEGRLAATGSATWPRVMITPGPRPGKTLRAALGALAGSQTVSPDARIVLVIDQLEEIFTLCESEAERATFLDEVGTLAADAGPGSALVVLGMRADFYARATAYPVLRQAMQSRQVVLGAMTAAEVRQAIVRPARAVGLTLEAGLVERLLHDLGVDESGDPAGDTSENTRAGGYEPGRLPLLAHALRATWQRREGNRLTIAGYLATGGIAGAIAQTAEDVYATLGEPSQAATRQLFLALVAVAAAPGDSDSDAAADTRRRVAADSLLGQSGDPAATRIALEAFTAARLLTSGGQAVEITHEALLRRWPRLRTWIDDDRSGLLTRQELEAAAATWAREGKDAASLYGGVRLAAAQAWAAAPERARELTQVARDFLAAAERRRRRGTRRRNGIIAVLAALSLVLAALAVFAQNQRNEAQSQRSAAQANFQKAEASALAAVSGQAWADFRPDTALKFAVQAGRLDPKSPQVRNALLATQTLPMSGRLLQANGQPAGFDMVGAAYNPAGTLIAGTTQDDRVQLWSTATYRQLWNFHFPSLDGRTGQANAAAFTPDGRTLIVTQRGGPWLFNVADPAHPVHAGTLTVPPLAGIAHPQVVSLAVSPDGSMVAAGVSTSDSALAAGVLLIWNLPTRTLAGGIPAPALPGSLTFTPDGKSLVAASNTGEVDLWDVARRAKTATLQPPSTTPSAPLAAVAVSPDGKTIAFGVETLQGGSPGVRLWSTATRQVTQTLKASASGVSSVAFSPSGRQLGAGSLDGTVRLWDLHVPSAPIGTFAGHRYPVEHVTFSPDGKTLASTSDDGSIGLWDTQASTLGGLANTSIATAFSPDGKTLAISTSTTIGPAIALYRMPARTLAGLLPVKSIAALAFSPDGKTLAVASANAGDAVQLWDVATRNLAGTLRTGMATRINSLVFSPDGTMLAVSAVQDTTMQVWSVAGLTMLRKFGITDKTQYPPQLGGGVFMVAFSPDGRLLAVVGIDGVVRVYKVPGFTLVSYFHPLDSTSSLAFSHDGRLLALGSSDGNVYLFAMPPASQLSPVPASEQSAKNSPWPAGTLAGSSKQIFDVHFLTSTLLIAGGTDGVVRFWAVPAVPGRQQFVAATPAQVIATHTGQIASISYSAPLQLLATASPSGTRVWDTDPSRVAASVCRSLKAPVRTTLWKEYLPDVPYTPVC
jgi:WD40 repeat protein